MNALVSMHARSSSLRRQSNRRDGAGARLVAFVELEKRLEAALETYSNVHRGAGHHSLITTELFERSREVILDCLGLDRERYVVIFGTPQRAARLQAQLEPLDYEMVSSQTVGLPLGLRALAVRKSALPRGAPLETGGGAVELVLPNSVIWADAPQRFEAGTPSVLNVIALAIALQLRRELGDDCFKSGREVRRARPAQEILREDALFARSGLDLLAELRAKRVGRDLPMPTAEGRRPFVNLDNAASTPTFWPVWTVVTEAWRQPVEVQAALVSEVKGILAAFLGAGLGEYRVLFTSNATEALNLAARLVDAEQRGDSGGRVLNTLLEHNSNELPWRHAAGGQPLRLAVDRRGFVSLAELERLLRERNQDRREGRGRIGLVAVSGGSNVLGTFNDIPAISRLVHRYGARLLVDAAQVVAHRAVRMAEWGIDYLVLSAHKAYAPFGTGALVVRREHVHVSRDELKLLEASGEENVAGIAALGKALLLLQRIGLPVIEAEEEALVSRLLRGLASIDGIEIFGIEEPAQDGRPTRGGVVSFSVKGVPHNLVAKRLAEEAGIGVRNGCFCAHLLLKQLLGIRPARALAARAGFSLLPGVTRSLLPGLVRVSLGLENGEADIDSLVGALQRIAAAPVSMVDRLLARGRNGTCVLPRTTVQREVESLIAERVQMVYALGSDAPARKASLIAERLP